MVIYIASLIYEESAVNCDDGVQWFNVHLKADWKPA